MKVASNIPSFSTGKTCWECPSEWNPPERPRLYGDPWCYIVHHEPDRHILWMFNPDTKGYEFLREGKYCDLREEAFKIWEEKQKENEMQMAAFERKRFGK